MKYKQNKIDNIERFPIKLNAHIYLQLNQDIYLCLHRLKNSLSQKMLNKMYFNIIKNEK